MSGFKRLLDSGQGALDELCRRFVRFYRYAKILKTIVEFSNVQHHVGLPETHLRKGRVFVCRGTKPERSDHHRT